MIDPPQAPDAPEPARDTAARPLRDLRISVTDRCNLRCSYCMPLARYEWLEREKILRFEEIARLVRIFVSLGVEKVRLTGGEPTLRTGLDELIGQIRSIDGVRDLSLTSNGVRLVELAPRFAAAGLTRLNVSLDTLDPARHREISRSDSHAAVLAGLEAARRAGLEPIKINTVVQRGVNDDEIVPLARFCRERGYVLRFIEFMDVGNANQWQVEKLVPRAEILETLGREFPFEEFGPERTRHPARRFRFRDSGLEFGVIASVSEPFCGACSRARITADGKLVTCLFSSRGIDLKGPLRDGASDATLRDLVAASWGVRRDRYSEERLAALLSAAGYDPGDRRKIEMITLGG